MAKRKTRTEEAIVTEAPSVEEVETLLSSIPEPTPEPAGEGPTLVAEEVVTRMEQVIEEHNGEAPREVIPISEGKPQTKVGWITWAIKELGFTPENVSANGANATLIEFLRKQEGFNYPKIENGFSVSKGEALRKLGWSPSNGNGKSTPPKPTEEPTISDLRVIKDFCQQPGTGLPYLEDALEAIESCLNKTGLSYSKLKGGIKLMRDLTA